MTDEPLLIARKIELDDATAGIAQHVRERAQLIAASQPAG